MPGNIISALHAQYRAYALVYGHEVLLELEISDGYTGRGSPPEFGAGGSGGAEGYEGEEKEFKRFFHVAYLEISVLSNREMAAVRP